MTALYIDADACPVREEVFRVATRLNLPVHLVSNGSRPIRPSGPPPPAAAPTAPRVRGPPRPPAAHDWIAERIGPADVCVTADIPLAARCLQRGARAVSPTGHVWTGNNIGNALAGRELARHLREMGMTGGQPSLSKADRSRFLQALDTAAVAAMRVRA